MLTSTDCTGLFLRRKCGCVYNKTDKYFVTCSQCIVHFFEILLSEYWCPVVTSVRVSVLHNLLFFMVGTRNTYFEI